MTVLARWLAASAIVLLVVCSMRYGYHALVDDHSWLRAAELQTSPSSSVLDSVSNTNNFLPDPPPPSVEASKEPSLPTWDPSWALKGPPTRLAKDNLKDDKFYITAWSSAGLTNQFINYVNMIYLGIMADRIPIIPPFVPNHDIPHSAGVFPFGRVFNMSVLRETIRIPVLEWSEVKDLPSSSISRPPAEELEVLGCWSTRKEKEHPIQSETMVGNLHLDVSYRRVPAASRHLGDGNDDFIDINKLVPFIFPNRPRPPLGTPLMTPSPLGHQLEPDQKLSCFDFLYYASSGDQKFEWERHWSPFWRFVGKHLRFTDSLVDITNGYLSRIFQTGVDEIPSFIAVHMRRTDFALDCRDKPSDCLIPLSIFQQKVDLVKKSILEKHNKHVSEVLLTSDDPDPAFWEEVRSIGWVVFDHAKEQTLEKYGQWYPAIIEITAQSMASGFVGTERSTFSLIASRRIEDWRDGPSIMASRRDRLVTP